MVLGFLQSDPFCLIIDLCLIELESAFKGEDELKTSAADWTHHMRCFYKKELFNESFV